MSVVLTPPYHHPHPLSQSLKTVFNRFNVVRDIRASDTPAPTLYPSENIWVFLSYVIICSFSWDGYEHQDRITDIYFEENEYQEQSRTWLLTIMLQLLTSCTSTVQVMYVVCGFNIVCNWGELNALFGKVTYMFWENCSLLTRGFLASQIARDAHVFARWYTWRCCDNTKGIRKITRAQCGSTYHLCSLLVDCLGDDETCTFPRCRLRRPPYSKSRSTSSWFSNNASIFDLYGYRLSLWQFITHGSDSRPINY